jgi:hypothetical protein
MKTLKISAILFFLSVLSACGSYNQVVQVNDQAFLLLIGNPHNSILYIDSGPAINLSADTISFNLNGSKATKIAIPIGNHTIKIEKNGKAIINRVFFVSTGDSFEVKL